MKTARVGKTSYPPGRLVSLLLLVEVESNLIGFFGRSPLLCREDYRLIGDALLADFDLPEFISPFGEVFQVVAILVGEANVLVVRRGQDEKDLHALVRFRLIRDGQEPLKGVPDRTNRRPGTVKNFPVKDRFLYLPLGGRGFSYLLSGPG